MVRPTKTDALHMGRVRKRSTIPVARSVARPTPVPMEDVTKFIVRSPAMAKFV